MSLSINGMPVQIHPKPLPTPFSLAFFREFFKDGQAAWNTLKSFPHAPWPLDPPQECPQYLDYSRGDYNTIYVGCTISLMVFYWILLAIFLPWVIKRSQKGLVRRFAEATVDERGRELERLCGVYGIKIEKGDSATGRGAGKDNKLFGREKGIGQPGSRERRSN